MPKPSLNNRWAATAFLSTAICDFGDSDEVKITAVQKFLDAAGFDATATCWPVFGGIWPKPCDGRDGAAATAWLAEVTKNLRRGDGNSEVDQLAEALWVRRGA